MVTNEPKINEIGNVGLQIEATTLLLSTLSCIALLNTLKYLWSRRYLYYYASKMGGPTPAWPIVGNALYFLGGNEDILRSAMMLMSTYKTPCRVWLGHRLFFCITKPKDLEVVMNKSLYKEQLYDFAIPVVGTGIFTAPVDKWKRHRKVILPTFKQPILNAFVKIFAEQAAILVTKLESYEGRGYFDVLPLVSSCTLDIICETALGKKVHSQTGKSDYVHWVERAMEIVFARMFHLWLHPDFIWNLTSLSRELNDISENIKNFLKKIVEEKKNQYRAFKALNLGNTPRKAFLDYVIELSEEGAHWTDDEILEEAVTIMVAGSDSTATMDSFILVMLGMHPEIQEKVYQELSSIFGDDNRNVTAEDLPKMTYLERVIKETLRLFPVGPVIVRALCENVQLESHTLPKGGSCVLGIITTHRDPEIWPEPLKFDPDRFLPEEAAKRHPYAFIPFSAGPRNCIGPKYAMMAMKSVMSAVVRHFRITTDFQRVADVKVKADLMIKAVDGCRVALERRNKH